MQPYQIITLKGGERKESKRDWEREKKREGREITQKAQKEGDTDVDNNREKKGETERYREWEREK